MKNRILAALAMLTIALVPSALQAAEPVADAVISNEGIGFSRVDNAA